MSDAQKKRPTRTARIRADTLSRLKLCAAQESVMRGRIISVMDLLDELVNMAEARCKILKTRESNGLPLNEHLTIY